MSRPPAAQPSSPEQQLSLFELPSAVADAGPPVASAQSGRAQAEPAVRDLIAALSPAVFRHPRAQREITLGGHLVAYEFRRGRRRSVGFVVGVDGLTVSAPRWLPSQEVDAALRSKAVWLLRKLQEQRERGRRLQEARVDWRDGATIPYLGETLTVVIDPRLTGASLNEDGQALPGVPRLCLHVGLPQQAAPEQIRDAVQSWLQRQARCIFADRCRVYAERLGVRVARLSLSSALTRWGSATAGGAVRLNWRLIHFAMPTIDYVVAHELAHLREMNHSAAFWEVVRSVLPDFEQARQLLRDDVLPDFNQ